MEIHTEDIEMKNHLEDAVKEINPDEERKFSEYELRLIIQDEMSCADEEIRRLSKMLNKEIDESKLGYGKSYEYDSQSKPKTK